MLREGVKIIVIVLHPCRTKSGQARGEKRFGVEFDIVSSAMGTKISLMGSHPPTTAFTRPAGLALVTDKTPVVPVEDVI